LVIKTLVIFSKNLKNAENPPKSQKFSKNLKIFKNPQESRFFPQRNTNKNENSTYIPKISSKILIFRKNPEILIYSVKLSILRKILVIYLNTPKILKILKKPQKPQLFQCCCATTPKKNPKIPKIP
jgi:hypothetical protein